MEELESCLSDGQLAEEKKMLGILRELTIRMREEPHRSNLQTTHPGIYRQLERIMKETSNSEIRVEIYRFLRNSMAYPGNQNHIREATGIIPETLTFLNESRNRVNEGDPMLPRACLQFLINCVIGNEENAKTVVEESSKFVGNYLEGRVKEAGYLINTLLNIVPEFASNFTSSGKFQLLLDDPDSEASLLCLETLASNTDFLQQTYHGLSMDQKLTFLHFLIASTCKKSVEFFMETFQLKADLILKSDLSGIESGFEEISLLTTLVSGFNQITEIEFLQKQGGFVMTIIQLLKMTKSSEAFEPREKLSQLTKEDQDHPTFLFKANLIRLLGNLAYHNPTNQLLIGQHCLPIILNYTKIDTLNPFITQWSILAVRNLLEDSPENQDLVRSLKLSGPAYSSVLQEFGIQVSVNEGGKLTVSKDEEPR